MDLLKGKIAASETRKIYREKSRESASRDEQSNEDFNNAEARVKKLEDPDRAENLNFKENTNHDFLMLESKKKTFVLLLKYEDLRKEIVSQYFKDSKKLVKKYEAEIAEITECLKSNYPQTLLANDSITAPNNLSEEEQEILVGALEALKGRRLALKIIESICSYRNKAVQTISDSYLEKTKVTKITEEEQSAFFSILILEQSKRINPKIKEAETAAVAMVELGSHLEDIYQHYIARKASREEEIAAQFQKALIKAKEAMSLFEQFSQTLQEEEDSTSEEKFSLSKEDRAFQILASGFQVKDEALGEKADALKSECRLLFSQAKERGNEDEANNLLVAFQQNAAAFVLFQRAINARSEGNQKLAETREQTAEYRLKYATASRNHQVDKMNNFKKAVDRSVDVSLAINNAERVRALENIKAVQAYEQIAFYKKESARIFSLQNSEILEKAQSLDLAAIEAEKAAFSFEKSAGAKTRHEEEKSAIFYQEALFQLERAKVYSKKGKQEGDAFTKEVYQSFLSLKTS